MDEQRLSELFSESDFEDAYWSVSQALSWITWGRLVEKDTNFLALSFIERQIEGDNVNIANAINELLYKLKSGKITATGIPFGSKIRDRIPDYQLIDLIIMDDEGSFVQPIYAISLKSQEEYGYRDIMLNRNEILNEWPSAKRKLKFKEAKRSYADEEVEQFFQEKIVQPWKDGKGPRVIGKVWHEIASRQFPGITTFQTRSVFKKLHPPGWTPGRPKSRLSGFKQDWAISWLVRKFSCLCAIIWPPTQIACSISSQYVCRRQRPNVARRAPGVISAELQDHVSIRISALEQRRTRCAHGK